MLGEGADYRSLLEGLYADSPAAWDEFYQLVLNFRPTLVGHVPSHEIQDCLHDLFLLMVPPIRQRWIQDPERLAGYIKRIVNCCLYRRSQRKKRQRMGTLTTNGWQIVRDTQPGPEEQVLENERLQLQNAVRRKLNPSEREILDRFYVQEQGEEQICREMGLTFNQYRNRKSRAKQKAVRLMQQCVQTRSSAGSAA